MITELDITEIERCIPTATRVKLLELIRRLEVHSVIEIGTFQGCMAGWFALQPEIESVTCIDPFHATGTWAEELSVRGVPNPFYDLFQSNMEALGVWNKIFPIRFLSQDVHCSIMPADLVSIDGDHTHKGCARDILLYGSKARKVFCGDDFHADENGRPYFPGVRRAVAENVPGYQSLGGLWWVEK